MIAGATVEERRVSVPGAALYVRRTGAAARGDGDAATLLAVHGGPGMSHEPLELLEELASPRLTVVTYDQRGAGRSSGTVDGPHIIEETLADLAAVVDASASAGPLHVLGHSWGGLIAALYAARHPARVASLILVDSIAPSAAALGAAMASYWARLRDFQARGLVPAELPGWEQDAAERLLAILPIYFVDPSHPAARTLGGTRFSAAVYGASRAALSAYDARAEIARVTQPALHFVAPVPFGPGMASGMADALVASPGRRVLLRDAGHLPFLERPVPFLAEIARFITEPPTPNQHQHQHQRGERP